MRRRRKNPDFTIYFSGKTRGAIGSIERHETTVSAKNLREALAKVYDRYDHVHGPHIIKNGKKYLIRQIIKNPLRRKTRRYRRNNGGCPACGGPAMELGSLGLRKHFRCRNCGMQWSKAGRRSHRKLSVYDSRYKKKNPRRRKYARRRR